MQCEDSTSVDGDNEQDSDPENNREAEDSDDEFWDDVPRDLLDQDISLHLPHSLLLQRKAVNCILSPLCHCGFYIFCLFGRVYAI